jgi:N-glycosylase/DNA lyase
VKKSNKSVTIEQIKETYSLRREEILKRLAEFEDIWQHGTDRNLWEEMVFCFFTGGCSAKMGLRSLEAVKPLLLDGTHEQLFEALRGKHRYPFARAGYIVASRDFLQADCNLKLREKLESFEDALARRDWLAKTKQIKGLGYKEASHYLRNIGFKGYAILDKHILRCLAELEILENPEPPTNRKNYLQKEQKLKELSAELEINFDELDLVLWSMKTGEILK